MNSVIDQAVSEIVPADAPLVAMFSGGGDSTALVVALARAGRSSRRVAMHVNYGLRGEESDTDERFCRELCESLGVELFVERAPKGFADAGNLQDRARDLRYAAAERLADELGPDALIATAHTADDQAETILYRLFASPGRRALQGMPAKRGRIVRPLIGLRRAELRVWLTQQGVDWCEDASNDDPRFARVRARNLLADAEKLHPAAVKNLLRTAELLREESSALSAVVDGLLADCTRDDGQLEMSAVAELPPALGAVVLREFVERGAGRPVPQAAHALADAIRLSTIPEPKELQVEGAKIAFRRGAARVVGR